MSNPQFKPGYLCIHHPEEDVESFPLVADGAYMFFDDNGAQKLAVEAGTDWVDFEESELIGGSETLARVWGIPIDEAQVRRGTKKGLKFPVANWDHEDGEVRASFFATEFVRVGRVEAEFPGDMRIKLVLHVDDITEETEECNTVITIDTVLKLKADLEPPD